jgi:hypothetical protein
MTSKLTGITVIEARKLAVEAASLGPLGSKRVSPFDDLNIINRRYNSTLQEKQRVYELVLELYANCAEFKHVVDRLTSISVGDGFVCKVQPASEFANEPTAIASARLAEQVWRRTERLLDTNFNVRLMREYLVFGEAYVVPASTNGKEITELRLIPSYGIEKRTGAAYPDSGYLPDEVARYLQWDPVGGSQIIAEWEPGQILEFSEIPLNGILYGTPFVMPAISAVRNIVEIYARIPEYRAAAVPMTIFAAMGPGGTSVDPSVLNEMENRSPEAMRRQGLEVPWSYVINNGQAFRLQGTGDLFASFQDLVECRKALCSAFGLTDDAVFQPGNTNVAVINQLMRELYEQARRRGDHYARSVFVPLFNLSCELYNKSIATTNAAPDSSPAIPLTPINLDEIELVVQVKEARIFDDQQAKLNAVLAIVKMEQDTGKTLLDIETMRSTIATSLGLDPADIEARIKAQAKQQINNQPQLMT